MNLLAALRTPWRSVHRSLRWLASVVLLLVTAAGIGIALFSSGAHPALPAAAVLGAGVFMLWAFFMSGLLLLAIDARKLRLPGVQREIHASLGLYAALSVAPAAALVWVPGADAVAITLVLALCAVVGLAFAVLPRYIAMFLGFMPAMRLGLKHVVDLPGPGEPGFMPLALVLIAVLLLACVQRWRQLLRADELPEGFGGAMVLQLRRNGAWGHWNTGQFDNLQMIRRRPDWLQPRADLHGVGPGTPRAAFRVALGHWYTPRSLGGHLQAMAPVLLSLLLGVGAMALIGLGDEHRRATMEVLKIGGVAMLGWVGIFGSMMLTLMTVQLIQTRWRKANTELPLLSLLPGLGDARQAKRDVLRAILRRPLCAQAVLLVLMLAVALGLHVSALGLVSIAVAQLSGIAVMAACVPAILGGRPLPTWGLAVLLVVVFMLISLGSFLPLMAMGTHPWEGASGVMGVVLGLWLAVGAVLLWLGRRGRRALAQRPHAFLANPG